MTESLWRGGGCRQDGLGTTAVLEPKSQVRALVWEEETRSLLEEEDLMERIQDSPKVASECLNVSLQLSLLDPPKVVSFWVFKEWRRPRVSLMEWRLLGCKELLAIMEAVKARMCT